MSNITDKAVKGLVCVITAFAVAIQASGAALVAGTTETVNKFGETTTFEFDDASRPTKMTYASGAYAEYTYDGRSRITAVEHKNSSNTVLRQETNTFDPASRITSRTDGLLFGGVATTFGYDDAGQLTSESSTGYSASYTYDANGNRATRTIGTVTETYTVDDSDKLTSVTYSDSTPTKTYTYHFSGRCTGVTQNGVTTTLTYDKDSRPTGIAKPGSSTASYAYNGFGARVSKTVGSNTTAFKRAGANALAPVVSDTVGPTTTGHVPGISSRVGTTSTFSHSGIKNGVLQTNASQASTATKRYDAFGNEVTATGTWHTSFTYGGPFGYQDDPEYGLKLLGHRYYDSSTGRFLSRDPIKSGRNWYGYCENSPIGYADPSGLATISIFGDDYEFSWGGFADGIETGSAAVLSAASDMAAGMANDALVPLPLQMMGVPGPFHGWDGGEYKDDPGFYGGKTIATIGLTAGAIAAGLGGIGRGACFVAGTQIAMADGTTKAIEDIRVGDNVLSRDQDADPTSPVVAAKVTQTFVRKTESTLLLNLGDGSTVETTPEHFIYAIGRGFVPAGTLTRDDRIAVAAGDSAGVVSVRPVPKPVAVYNFEVAGTHTYFVTSGERSLWVHNLPCSLNLLKPRAGLVTTGRRLPFRGPKNSVGTRFKDGKVVQERFYRGNGKPKFDIDRDHHPELGPRHLHSWDRERRGPGRRFEE